jgi:hypothetical protein
MRSIFSTTTGFLPGRFRPADLFRVLQELLGFTQIVVGRVDLLGHRDDFGFWELLDLAPDLELDHPLGLDDRLFGLGDDRRHHLGGGLQLLGVPRCGHSRRSPPCGPRADRPGPRRALRPWERAREPAARAGGSPGLRFRAAGWPAARPKGYRLRALWCPASSFHLWWGYSSSGASTSVFASAACASFSKASMCSIVRRHLWTSDCRAAMRTGSLASA